MNSEDLKKRRICVMGVAGCGKSTLGTRLAERLGLAFLEGDTFHSRENRTKMGQGVPLTDEDREPWVEAMCAAVSEFAEQGEEGCVLACSALRRAHRARLKGAGIEVFLHLAGDPEVIRSRLRDREATGHYMKASMLESQLQALEPPEPGDPVCLVDVSYGIDEQLRMALEALRSGSAD